MIERRNISIEEITDPELETRAGVEETTNKRYIMGYASMANLPSRQITEKINGHIRTFTEVIGPDAFAKADLKDVMFNVDHNPDKMIARTSAKNLTVKPTEKGLFFRAEIPNTTVANDLYENIQAGNYRENSFAFKVENDTWENRNGTLYRTINSISKVVDVSSVIQGAYQADILFTRNLDESIVKEVKEENAPLQFDSTTVELDFKMSLLKFS